MADSVRQLRLVLWVDDLDAALGYFRDALGLRQADAIVGPGGARVVIMDAGRATLELINEAQAGFITEVENAGSARPRVRVAFEVADAQAAARALADAGMPLIAAAVRTPWNSLNARLAGVGDVQVTVFEELGPAPDLLGSDFAALGGEPGLLRAVVDLATQHGAGGVLPFAAAVVRNGAVIGVGVNSALGELDVSAHAEVAALRDAARRVGTVELAGATVYASCEPCALCRVAVVASEITEIVFAAGRELVPAELDPRAGTTHRLMDAVAGVLPGSARAGSSSLDADALAAPFRAYRAATTNQPADR